MATSFYNQSSVVDDFLKDHRSRLNEDKSRLKRRGQDGGSPMVGILPSNEGRDQTVRQKETDRRNEYRQYLQEREGHTHNRRTEPHPSSISEGHAHNRQMEPHPSSIYEGHAHTRRMEPRPSSISEIRRQMQKERETEITFGTDNNEPTSRRRGVARDPYTDPISERRRTPVKEVGGASLGMIGYKKEESPEEKHQRQSKYREELFEQMKRKGKEVTTATSMGPTQLFREDDEAVTRRRAVINKGEGPNMERRPRRERPIDPIYSDEEDEDVKFNNYHPRPSRYRDYPYYPPPHGPHPPPMPHPSSQYHPGYVQPYYYPSPYPQMYPPPMPHPPPPMPHPPPLHSYYMQEDNPYLSERYGRSQLNRRSPPRVHSPPDYPTRSGRSPTLPNKESRRSQRYEQSIPEQKSKGAELRAILDQQIKEKQAREAKEKQEINKLYRKIDAEAEIYDPWGKPGCGAPLTDPTGNLVAERGLLRQSFEETSPRVDEEERKRAAQERMKRDLEEQIKENKERQMREKYKRQQDEELEEKKLLEELGKLNVKEGQEIQEERKRKQTEEVHKQQERASVVSQPQLTPQQLAEQRLKEENEKKRIKEEEERRRVERLAEKMASDTRPAWKQRSSSPPIPTLRGNRSPQIPPYPSAHPPVEPHPRAPSHQDHTFQVLYPPMHTQNTMPHPPETTPRPPSNDRSHSPPIPALRNNQTHEDTSGHGQMGPPNHHIPNDNERSHMTTGHVTSATGHVTSATGHVTSATGHVTSATGHVTNGPVYEREQSRELMQGLSDLKQQIRSTMSTTSATDTRRQRNPVHSKRNSLSSATLQQFNRLKYSRPSEGRMRFISQYPDVPRTNTALETQQEALLRHQSDDSHLHQRDSNESVLDNRHRPPTGLSNFTIATMDIDSLANRNEERARRLEAILNVNRGTQPSHINPQTVLNEFLSRQENPQNR